MHSFYHLPLVSCFNDPPYPACFIFHFTGTVSCFSFQTSLFPVTCLLFRRLHVSCVSNASCFQDMDKKKMTQTRFETSTLSPGGRHSDHCTMMGWLEKLHFFPIIDLFVSCFKFQMLEKCMLFHVSVVGVTYYMFQFYWRGFREFCIWRSVYICPYVCTYGALLGIRLTEGCQSVGNKRASEQHLMCDLAVIPRFPDWLNISFNTLLLCRYLFAMYLICH